MAKRILAENGHFIPSDGDRCNRDIGITEHPRTNRANPTLRHNSSLRVSMTGHLVVGNDECDSSSDDDENDVSRPRKNGDIVEPKETKLDEIESRFQKIVSDYNDHKHVLSKFRERRAKLASQISSEHKARSAPPTAYSLRGDVMIQENTHHSTHNLDNHNAIGVSSASNSFRAGQSTLNRYSNPSTIADAGVDGRRHVITADYFRIRIQALEKFINPSYDMESHPEDTDNANQLDEFTTDGNENNSKNLRNELGNDGVCTKRSPFRRNRRGKIEQQAGISISRINLEENSITNGADTSTGSSAPKSNVEMLKKQTMVYPKNQERKAVSKTASSRIKTRTLTNDPSSGLNETMSSWSSSGDVEMGLSRPANANVEKIRGPTTLSTIFFGQGVSRHRLLMTSGILLVAVILFGVGAVLGYVSYMNSSTN